MISLKTIEGERGFFVECDNCSYYQFFPADNFVDAVKEAQRQGWVFKLDEEKDWEHFCEERKGKRCKKQP